ncbi:MAG: beta family protein [Campylobacter sp.]|uniref:beta family protein n=1 Tax=Campylobacter sp. TaxID=205 RepID=UPI002AA6BCD7|nr:hypothetical protein [Campylobacter sp.]MCI6695050.1 beta family protein [Campylobacter sp.]
MKYFYFPALKTRSSELKAFSKLENKNGILPILALTKSRISKNNPIGSIDKKMNELKEDFKNIHFILDVSTEESLINSEIGDLLVSDDGFKNWVEFIKKYKRDFKNLIPCIHFSPDSSVDVKKQILNLDEFEILALRLPGDEDLNEYLNIIDNREKIILILDCLDKYNELNLSNDINNFKGLIYLASNFPKTLAENEGVIELKEQEYYLKNLSSKYCYGDYGCAYPVRYDMIARSWIPRIDIPVINNDEAVVYYKKNRTDENTSTEEAYIKIAQKLWENEIIRRLNIVDNWGYKFFMDAAKYGTIFGKSPSFWISVRMNIYMSLTLNKMKNLVGAKSLEI